MSKKHEFTPEQEAGLRQRLSKSNYAPPGTEREEAADTAYAQQARAAFAAKQAHERKLAFLQSKLESAWEYGDKAAEKRLAEAIEQELLALGAIRTVPNVEPNNAVAKSELGADRRRGANALDTILHQPTLRKDELPDPLQ